jgi:hypothetical protein
MKKIIFRIKKIFETSDELPRGEYPDEDRKKDFYLESQNCFFCKTVKHPLSF